jgi:hypothetical protein
MQIAEGAQQIDEPVTDHGLGTGRVAVIHFPGRGVRDTPDLDPDHSNMGWRTDLTDYRHPGFIPHYDGNGNVVVAY